MQQNNKLKSTPQYIMVPGS